MSIKVGYGVPINGCNLHLRFPHAQCSDVRHLSREPCLKQPSPFQTPLGTAKPQHHCKFGVLGTAAANNERVTKDGVPISRIFKNQDFGYRTITVELPLRDTENVPLGEDVEAYFQREVLPHAPDAWIDHDKTKVGYEIPFNRHFYVFKPPRDLAEIDAELKGVTDRILTMIQGLSK